MSAAPGTVWRRALRRVTRRSAAFRSLRPLAYIDSEHQTHCEECALAWLLLCEAVRLANRLTDGGMR